MSGPIEWFARNHIAANLLFGTIVMAGLVALPSMPQKIFPDVDIKLITISVLHLGAAPEEVEEGVCIRIEEELEGVEDVKEIRSNAVEGSCSVQVELYEDADEARALDDVKNRVDSIDTFPEETEKPIITLVTQRRSVMDIALTGPEDERALKQLGQRVRDEIAALPEVTHVELSNTRPYEISIEVSEASLRRYGLSFDQVADALRSASLDLPGGSIKADGGEVLLRTKGQAYWGPEFENLLIMSRPDGARVYLRDVAQVVDGFEDTDQKMWFDGQPTALVRVSRVGSQDILEITAALNAYVERAETTLPEGARLTVWSDNSVMLRDRLDVLITSARQGFLMVLILLTLFLRPRLSFWVSIGVPVAFMGGLFLASILGMSINAISLFGFLLVLGILVDDAVVVGEKVYTLQQEAPPTAEGMLNAAVRGTKHVSVPVIFGVLTTATTFSPLLLGPGSTGDIISVIATIVMACLAFSLIESQLVLPAHLGHQRIQSASGEVGLMLVPLIAILLLEFAWDTRSYIALALGVVSVIYAWYLTGHFERVAAGVICLQSRFSDNLERLINTRFRSVVEASIANRYFASACALAVLIASLGVLVSGRLPFSFFPPLEADGVMARLTMPLGTPARVTEQAVMHLQRSARDLADELAAKMPEHPPVTHILAAVGGHPVSSSTNGPPTINPSVAASGGHLGEVTLQLSAGQERPELKTRAVGQMWRDRVGAIPDATELVFDSSLFIIGEAINIQLAGDNLDELREVAARIRRALAEYPGVIDISDSFRSGKQELKLSTLPSGEALGLSLGSLARQVRQAFYGEEAQRIQRGRDDVRVMVRYTESERRSLAALESMRIRTPDGSEVPFATIANADLGQGFSTIRRTDARRVVNVTADVDRTVTTSNEVLALFLNGPLQQILRDYPTVTYDMAGAQQEQAETATAILPLFGLALFVIYTLLAVPLRSYSQPLIIMGVIPFALVGSVIGHLVMKSLDMMLGLSMMSAFGFIAASGVVVNSSLVLVHSVNHRRAEGTDLYHAVVEAAVSRCRPIVLTSLTTFVGLTPLMINQSVQAQFLVPMATSLAFGVLFSTVVTLLVVPSGYLVLQDLERLFAGRREESAEALPEPGSGGR
ncbi:MAG: efflux RND transporter permease subunit [Pseudomonadales bacterium]|jgi:multidrug efflux pump subunit AcrB|nr:efflux RND transporter permease subunit [Pseudomonadales bacterium]MDP6470552.1 efflux RND transporter permease subunit [Pseudomonadales bacterium]MDP6827854.1 efflux RND transporter permease subunit [Pseudomonadales bacterium]MDP6970557.1 efflux RND transporter permease subunit [Pseudomonadales bacterium]